MGSRNHRWQFSTFPMLHDFLNTSSFIPGFSTPGPSNIFIGPFTCKVIHSSCLNKPSNLSFLGQQKLTFCWCKVRCRLVIALLHLMTQAMRVLLSFYFHLFIASRVASRGSERLEKADKLLTTLALGDLFVTPLHSPFTRTIVRSQPNSKTGCKNNMTFGRHQLFLRKLLKLNPFLLEISRVASVLLIDIWWNNI